MDGGAGGCLPCQAHYEGTTGGGVGGMSDGRQTGYTKMMTVNEIVML